MTTGSKDLSYAMRVSRKKCAPGIGLIILLIIKYNWNIELEENSVITSTSDVTEVVMQNYFHTESTRRLFKGDDLNTVIRSMKSESGKRMIKIDYSRINTVLSLIIIALCKKALTFLA